MFRLHKICFAVFACLTMAMIASAQTTPSENATVRLNVSGEVERTLNLTAADLVKLPRRSLRAKGHDGKQSEFEGVPVVEILQLAGVKFGDGLRGKNLALYLLVEASDGYRAVYALPELDPAFTDKIILLADKRDGKQLDSKEGPLRIVVPDERRQSRWVHQVIRFVVKRSD